ncbi:unnamed protein product [Callosobruchus maculatus]|uniref:LRRCT domain-containing protein n=1 Tax=Callosobruchus maculatus TaxID=64391 RepID=A0A653CFM2_CALMS|nr:unnamed protein product [Callosobruchus maculatus]
MRTLVTFLTFSMMGSISSGTIYREDCDAPYIERSTTTHTTPQYYGHYYRDYDRRDHHNDGPCDYGLRVTVDVTCNLMSYMKSTRYYVTQTICTQDNVRFFTRSGSHIPVLPGSAFAAEFEISELHLSNIGLTKIIPGAFNLQPNIKTIYLNKNNLTQITVGLFNSLSHLELLSLSDNQITSISEDAFSSVPLEKLYLSGNKLLSLPDSFAEIKTLDISYNCINKVDPSVDFYTLLFNGSNNEIKEFNTSKFVVIQDLHLANNRMKYFYVNNGRNTLEKLDLFNNSFAKIPENIYNLKLLNLGANIISSLPNGTLNSSLLEELNLSANNLTYIPSLTFKQLTLLKFLDLSENRISSFTFGTFDGLDSLRFLNISHNKFKALPFRTFHALKNLRNIDFSGNEIEDMSIAELFKTRTKSVIVRFESNVFSCHKLLEIIHNLETREVSFIRRNYVDGDNIYGIKCTDFNELIDVKGDAGSSRNNTAYSGLISYLNSGFEDSRFAQYLGDLSNSSVMSNLSTDIKQLLKELMDRDRTENNYFVNLTKKLEANLSNIVNEYAKQNRFDFERAFSENYRHLNMSMEIDKNLNEALNKIANELNENSAKDLDLYKTLLSLRQMLNDTISSNKNERDLLVKKFFDLNTDMKMLLEALKAERQQDFKLLLDTLGKIQIKPSMLMPEISESNSFRLSHSEKLGIHSENEATVKTSPVLILIAILLLIIAMLILGLGYVVLFRIKYIVNQKSDVELTRLVESRSNDVCE